MTSVVDSTNEQGRTVDGTNDQGRTASGRLRPYNVRTTLADMREARLLLQNWEDMVLKPLAQDHH